MGDAVLFHHGIASFILATPFLQNLDEPVIFMLRGGESAAPIRAISRWPVRDFEDAGDVAAQFDRVFILWGWPEERVVEGANVVRRREPNWRADPRHEARTYLDLLPDAQAFPPSVETRWSWRPTLGDGERLIALVNGASPARKNKRWPDDSWCDLARHLVADGRTQLAVLGGAAEAPLGRALVAAVGRRCWNFTGVWDFARSAHFLTWCDIIVANDSALLHAAEALNRPVVALWAWTSWTRRRPYHREVRVVRSDGGGCPDFPCEGTPAMSTCEDAICMKAIPVDRVLDEVNREQ
ncbi:MAG: glycosyltransferase family 9 protein [Deltaproteobacteria bacterium]|nr:glycosyltransferase family 9 protein [Deltaproteobacteria bacterium]